MSADVSLYYKLELIPFLDSTLSFTTSTMSEPIISSGQPHRVSQPQSKAPRRYGQSQIVMARLMLTVKRVDLLGLFVGFLVGLGGCCCI